jgi:hypothetical protein
MRHRLERVCNLVDLLAYMEQYFAHTGQSCRHTFMRIDAYFSMDPQQAAVYALLVELGEVCDCEAFFVLWMLPTTCP